MRIRGTKSPKPAPESAEQKPAEQEPAEEKNSAGEKESTPPVLPHLSPAPSSSKIVSESGSGSDSEDESQPSTPVAPLPPKKNKQEALPTTVPSVPALPKEEEPAPETKVEPPVLPEKTQPSPEKKAEPSPEKKVEPAPEKKAEPAPEKKAESAPAKETSGDTEATPVSVPASVSVPAQKVQVGDTCSALYKGKYYIAKILEVLDDGNQVKIKFEKFKFFPVVHIKDLRFPEAAVLSPRTAKRQNERLEEIAQEEAEYRAATAKHEADRKAEAAKAEAERKAAAAKVEAERQVAAAAAIAEHQAKAAKRKAQAEAQAQEAKADAMRTKTERVVVTEQDKGFSPPSKDLDLTELFRDDSGRVSVGSTIKTLRTGKRVFNGQRLPNKFYMLSKRLSKHRKYDVWYTIVVRDGRECVCLPLFASIIDCEHVVNVCFTHRL